MAAGECLAIVSGAASGRVLVAAVVALAAVAASEALAFNAPEDASGPVTASIEGPAVVTTTGEPVAYTVRVENSGRRTVEGAVRLGLEVVFPMRPGLQPAELNLSSFAGTGPVQNR